MNKDNEDGEDSLFFKIWRNIYIRSIITNQLELIRDYSQVTFTSLNEMKQFKYREYVETVIYDGIDMIESVNDIPPNCKSLELGSNRLSSISSKVIPNLVEFIQYPFDNNSPVQTDISELPKSVTSIKYVKSQQQLYEFLPKHIKELTFCHYNQKLIPSMLNGDLLVESIDFGNYFTNSNTILQGNSIPPSVKKLNLGRYTSTLNRNVILNGVIELTMCCNVDPYLDVGVLPNSIKKLSIVPIPNKSSSLEISVGSIPSNAIDVTLKSDHTIIESGSLPNTIELLRIINLSIPYNHKENTLELDSSFFPSNLRSLFIGAKPNIIIKNGSLPSQLQRLSFLRYDWDATEKELYVENSPFFPPLLKHLEIGSTFSSPLPLNMPQSLTHLDLGVSWNHPIKPNQLPPNLTYLILSDHFNHPLEVGSIPNCVKQLYFGRFFNHPLPSNIFPHSVVRIGLSTNFNQPIDDGAGNSLLPPSLTSLSMVTQNYEHTISVLPTTLNRLQISNSIVQKQLISPDLLNKIENKRFY